MMKAGKVFRKTLPFCWAKLLLGAVTVLVSCILLALFLGIGWIFGEGGIWIGIILWCGSIGVIRFVIMHYFGTRPVSPYATNILGYTQKQDIIYTFIKYNRVYHALRSVELEIKGEVKEIILLRTGKSVPFIQKGNKVVVDTKDFPLYDMKYADCLKILFENPKGE